MIAFVRGSSVLEGVPAASGIELSNDGKVGFVCGDNSHLLYTVDLSIPAGKIIQKTRLMSSKPGGRDEDIEKKHKPDLECLAAIPYFDVDLKNVIKKAGDDPSAFRGCIAAVGSGSKSGVRDMISLADPTTGHAATYSIKPLMDAFRADKRITGDAKLNLEAATLVGPSTFALFQRGNVAGGKNSVILMDLEALRLFLIAIRDHHKEAESSGSLAPAIAAAMPCYTVVHLQVPTINGPDNTGRERTFNGGVSGASTITLPVGSEESAHGCAAVDVASPVAKEGVLAPGVEDMGIGSGSGGRTVAVPIEAEARIASTAASQSHDAAAHHSQPHHRPHQASDVTTSEFILLSISYEGTDNEIDDGPVLGSRVAILPARALSRHSPSVVRALALEPAAALSGSPNPPLIDISPLSALVLPEATTPLSAAAGVRKPALVKIEGIGATKAEVRKAGDDVVDISCSGVTDPDGEASQLLDIQFTVPVNAVKAALATGLATKTGAGTTTA
jgi:hypothetical protein